MSCQPCGCDPEANHVCERHDAEGIVGWQHVEIVVCTPRFLGTIRLTDAEESDMSDALTDQDTGAPALKAEPDPPEHGVIDSQPPADHADVPPVTETVPEATPATVAEIQQKIQQTLGRGVAARSGLIAPATLPPTSLMPSTVKLDKKFQGDLRKVKDGSPVPADEYIVFLAKDDAVPAMLHAYYAECVRLRADAEQLAMVEALQQDVDRWRAAHADRCKVPDAAGERRLP